MTALRFGRLHPDVGAVTISFTLSLIAGVVDVTSFVLLNGLFAAHITGNIVVLAAALAFHRPVRLSTALAPSTAVMTGNIVASTVALVGLVLDGFGAHRGMPARLCRRPPRRSDI